MKHDLDRIVDTEEVINQVHRIMLRLESNLAVIALDEIKFKWTVARMRFGFK